MSAPDGFKKASLACAIEWTATVYFRSRQRTRPAEQENPAIVAHEDAGPVSVHNDPFQTSFGEPQRESVSVRTSSSTRTSFSTSSSQPGRRRLEVQSIRVWPNADLAREEDAAIEEETNAASFGGRRDPARAGVIRNRVRQRRPLRHRGNAEQNY